MHLRRILSYAAIVAGNRALDQHFDFSTVLTTGQIHFESIAHNCTSAFTAVEAN